MGCEPTELTNTLLTAGAVMVVELFGQLEEAWYFFVELMILLTNGRSATQAPLA